MRYGLRAVALLAWTPVTITKTTTMKTILGWVQSGVCSLDWALMEYMELVLRIQVPGPACASHFTKLVYVQGVYLLTLHAFTHTTSKLPRVCIHLGPGRGPWAAQVC